jgi:hypothetical protein
MVADTNEINLTPDTADFTSVVNLGDKAIKRTLIRKTRGLFQRSADNAAAITAETQRSQTVESSLSSRITAEETRARAAEQINANAIAAEVLRATQAENNLSDRINAETARSQTAESGLSARITAEETRARTAEATNATAIAAEVTRAMSAEAGLAASILAEETRAKAAERANATAIEAEETRARLAEQALAQSILDVAVGAQSDWNQTDSASLAFIHNKPTSMPASDVHPWAKSLFKPSYTPAEVGAEPAFSKNTAFNRNFGTAAGTVCEGNDSRLSNARAPTAHNHTRAQITDFPSFGSAAGTICEGNDTRLSNARTPTAHTHTRAQITDFPTSMPASDVFAWAKAATKPSYTAAEVGAEPAFSKNTAFNRNFGTAANTVCEGNDTRLSNARTPTAHTHGNNDLTGIAAWAKAATKPSYTPAEVGAEPAFSKNTGFNRNFGTTASTVCEGNDSRLSNSRTPTSHASTATTFGEGTPANFGHVRLSSLAGNSGLVTGDSALTYNYTTVDSTVNLNNYLHEGRFTLYNPPTSITESVNNFPPGWNTGSQNANTAYLEVRRFFNTTGIRFIRERRLKGGCGSEQARQVGRLGGKSTMLLQQLKP